MVAKGLGASNITLLGGGLGYANTMNNNYDKFMSGEIKTTEYLSHAGVDMVKGAALTYGLKGLGLRRELAINGITIGGGVGFSSEIVHQTINNIYGRKNGNQYGYNGKRLIGVTALEATGGVIGTLYNNGLTSIGYSTTGDIVDVVLDKSWGNWYENELSKHNNMEKSHD